MHHFPIKEIKQWDRFYRGNFINSLSGFKSVSLIGTVNKAGEPNLAVFSNIVHIGSDPALIGFINRPIKASPHTLSNIEMTGFYSVNHIQQNFVQQAHQTSAKYDATVDEFVATGLTAIYKDKSQVPFVAESNISYLLKLVEVIPIKHNNTFLVIGEVIDVYLPDNIVKEDGFIDIEKAGSITSLGIDGYYTCEIINRFKYAKPGTLATNI
ncbi:MAG: flavin reductase [Ferruginibacter sp.]|nr:flavin reductase [Ferruginibacter sp.]